MYPDENLSKNQVPYKEQIQSVQTAVNQFREANGGILPIKTRDASTPIYQKYPIDFHRITPTYMAEPPGNSFESGGIFQYVLINVEKDPTVKIFDLRIADKIRELNIRIHALDYPPFKAEVANNVYSLDYKQIGYKEEQFVTSPYTQNNLPFVINGSGDIFVDYRSDLFDALKKEKNLSFKSGDDIRSILTKNSDFVPAYSLPYTVDEKNEPIFMTK
ncbi:hypothetical protein [Falsibacillus albus]|uniref:DUF3939 domain-containing protein n=1 Tax=Falsibacillus albus TaxID=2478915 RepID=A0A3L7JYQ5_9BACI|nr:hypothetical protein [Falsibacillus albus]RLQ95239.1 hypothetical protein D9X91_11345 [Falsibacillus albus]